MNYRPEIDGLRALAVLPVIFFHADVAWITGGYIGVDVFFVISGFLITTILLNELAEGNYSILRFYERRARRILPALFFVLICTFVPAYLWMFPTLFADYSRSLGATALFISNAHFWESTNYFGPAGEFAPLLHTWSLAIEEQFYLIFPLLLLAIMRTGRSAQIAILAVIFLMSLALSEWGWRHKPVANYYFTFSRFWELLAGSLCALMLIDRKRPFESETLALSGICIILASMFVFDETTPYPSVFTLIPVAGSAMIILFAGPGTRAAKLLSDNALVGVGLVSYSAYLWHQPLFAFARLHEQGNPSQTVMLALSFLTLPLAWATWRWVELPFRRRDESRIISRKNVFRLSGFLALVFLAIGLIGINDGLPGRAAPVGTSYSELGIEEKLAPNQGFGPTCDKVFKLSEDCRNSDGPRYLIWGDSYAMHLVQAVVSSPGDPEIIQHTKSRCVPILGLSAHSPDYTPEDSAPCQEFNRRVMEWLTSAPSVHTVVLSSPFGLLESGVLLPDGSVRNDGLEGIVLQALSQTIESIRATGKRVVLVSPPPATGQNIGYCLALARSFGGDEKNCDFDRDAFSPEYLLTVSMLRRLDETYPVVWLEDLICRETRCLASEDGVFTYRDSGHLSKEGSARIGRQFDFLALVNVAN